MCWQRTNPSDFIFEMELTKIWACIAAAWQENGLLVQEIIGCVTWVCVEERIGHITRKGVVPLSLPCSILSCAYIPFKCLLYRLRVDHIEHIFKCDRPAFLINKIFLFSLGKGLSRVQRMKERMVGTELRHYLTWGQCCLYKKNYSYLLSFFRQGLGVVGNVQVGCLRQRWKLNHSEHKLSRMGKLHSHEKEE